MIHTSTVNQLNKPETISGKYSCQMHAEIIRSEPGSCPICGMNLTLIEPTGVEEKKEYTDLSKLYSSKNFTKYLYARQNERRKIVCCSFSN